jgi:hypothetical protein
MAKSVVRNAQYRRGGLGIRQRHNERQNADYMNDDIVKDRAAYNVHYKQAQGSYESTFDKMVADGVISTRGLGKDPFIVDELVFDVNTAYFENGGGYDYAVSFFEEAYRCAVEEIGGEQYVLSAVMHADERNKALSELLGRDVFHYHLHVVYVPVVDKEIYFKKNNKDPELAGKLREVIKQVSHSKKWPKLKQLDENGEVVRNAKGKAVLVNSYSLLQDRYHDHMKQAGYIGFERGERNSTAEHLTVLEFKAKQEAERAAAMTAVVEDKEQAAAALDTAIEGKEHTAARLDAQTEKKQKRLEQLDESITVKGKAAATVAEVEAMGKPALIGSSLTVTADEMKTLKTLAKKSVTADRKVADMRKKLTAAETERDTARAELAQIKPPKQSIREHLTWFEKFTVAMKRAPKRLMEVIEDILRQPPERKEPQRETPQHKRNNDLAI